MTSLATSQEAHDASRLMLGTLHLRDLPERHVESVLDTFVAQGGHFIDTATLYGGMPLLSRIGTHLRRTAADVSVWIKVGYFTRAGHYLEDAAFAETAERAIEAIGPSATVVVVHEADWRMWWSPYADKGALVQPEDDLRLMERLARFEVLARRLGLRLGLSGNHAGPLSQVVARAPDCAAVLVAKQYDVLWRNATDLIEDADRCGRPLVVGAPWHQGWLRDLDALCERRPHLVLAITRLRDICRRAGLSVEAVALPFVLSTARRALVAFGRVRLRR